MRIDARDLSHALRGERFVDLVVALGGKFRRRNGASTLRMPCFLHGGSDLNMAVTPSEGLWHCHSTCGGGDAIELVERARGIDFQEALAWLGEWFGGSVTRPMPAPTPRKRAVSTEPLMRDLWRIVEHEPLGARAQAWLAGRGIDPDAALVMGWRDWSGRRSEIGELLRAQRPEVVEAAGFGAQLGWAPISKAHDPQWDGLAVPAWGLGESHPTRWRWRLYDAPEGEPKSRSPIGGGADLLGLGRPCLFVEHDLDGAKVDTLEDVGGYGADPRANAGCTPITVERSTLSGANFALPCDTDTLILVEGEPDWLSCVEAVNGPAHVVAVCGGGTGWRDVWPAFGELVDMGISRVVVCVHHGKRMAPCAHCERQIEAAALRCRWCAAANDSARTDGRGHGEIFAADVAECARVVGISVRRRLPEEAFDLNDMHKLGELAGWLRETLGAP